MGTQAHRVKADHQREASPVWSVDPRSSQPPARYLAPALVERHCYRSYVAGTQYVLGIRPDWEGLLIAPVIDSSWDGFTATRRFGDATYVIVIKNPKHVECGVSSITVDGESVPTNQALPLAAPGSKQVQLKAAASADAALAAPVRALVLKYAPRAPHGRPCLRGAATSIWTCLA